MLIPPLRKWLEVLSQPLRGGPGRRPRPRPPLRLEALEDRSLLAISVLSSYPGVDFAGSNGSTVAPDPTGAAGATNYVETVNNTVAIFSPKATGATKVTSSDANFWFTAGSGLTATAGFSLVHPTVVWDNLVNRFLIGEQYVDAATHTSKFFLAVSRSQSPATLTTGDWRFFSITTTEAGFDADYPGNMGFNADALVFTLNMNPTGAGNTHVQVNSVKISSLLTGTLTAFQNDLFGNLVVGLASNLRPTTMHDSVTGDPMWLIQETGDNADLTVYQMTNVLSNAAVFTPNVVPVNPYSTAVPPQQPGGTVTSAIDSRILKVAEQNNTLVASQTVANAAGTEDDAAWYTIDVTGGSPTLLDQGTVGGGPGVYDYFPGIDINPSSGLGMSFMQSTASQFPSMYVTGRTAFDPSGTMAAPVLVKAGTANITANFAGLLSGINVDANGSFWAVNEYGVTEAANNWATAIANFETTFQVQTFGVSGTEGQQLTNVRVGAVTGNAGPLGAWSATINWGDGTATGGQVVSDGSGGFFVLGTHTYVNPGSYTLTVTVSNATFNASSTGTAPATIGDAPLSGSSQGVGVSVFTSPFNALVGVFHDTDSTIRGPGNYSATVTWTGTDSGSHTVTGRIVSLGGNNFAVYADSPDSYSNAGTFPVTVFVRDLNGGASTTINSNVNVFHVAAPSLIAMYLGDNGPLTQLFLNLDDALVALITAENQYYFALFNNPALLARATFNLEVAFYRYEFDLQAFDMNLAMG